MRHLGGMSVDDAIMELLLERIIDNVELPLSDLTMVLPISKKNYNENH